MGGGGLKIYEMRLRRSRFIEMGVPARRRRIFLGNRSTNVAKRSNFSVKMPSEGTQLKKNRACGALDPIGQKYDEAAVRDAADAV